MHGMTIKIFSFSHTPYFSALLRSWEAPIEITVTSVRPSIHALINTGEPLSLFFITFHVKKLEKIVKLFHVPRVSDVVNVNCTGEHECVPVHMNFLVLTLCVPSVCHALEAYAIGKILLSLHTVITEILVPKQKSGALYGLCFLMS
jgi:hypothetical protein